jgi:predicted tellurium resistance membrane protein TerC
MEILLTLIMLILLQAVLGFDNLLYISLESKRAPLADQAKVRKWGIGLAIVLRIVLLFGLMQVLELFEHPFPRLHLEGIIDTRLNLHGVIVMIGGAFIIYTAFREIYHMLSLDNLGHGGSHSQTASSKAIIGRIVLMNLVFSFDSILSAMALTDSFWVMTTAIIVSGGLMIWLADRVSEFLQKNRMYEVLGLFVLFVVGIMLVSEVGGHGEQVVTYLKLFGHKIQPMSKATFYFVIAILVLVDLVQSRYQKNLLKMKAAELSNQG